MSASRPLLARISGAALAHNLQVVRQFAPGARILAVVKADAYGHGLAGVLPFLAAADGFAVVGLDAAIQCRSAFADRPVVLLEGPFDTAELALIAEHRLTPVIHSGWQIDLMESRPRPAIASVALKFNTGMNRLGFDQDAGRQAHARLAAIAGVSNIMLMSHLACADDLDNDFTRLQTQRFESVTASLPGEKSLANSAAVAGWPETHYQWLRPGIMLYGSSPVLQHAARDLGLEPVMTLQSRLIAVQSLKQGDAVGYGQTWTCPEDMDVGIVACGYGDGYPRHAPSATPVLVNGQRVALVGRVSMDTLAVDLRGVNAQVNDAVVLWGEGLPVDEIAAAAGTIAYELLTGVTARVPRVY